MNGYVGDKYVGKTAHDVVFDILLDQVRANRAGDLTGTAVAIVDGLVEWGYPLAYSYEADSHAAESRST